ncbi:poly-gamma-glutamate synthase PgsB [Pseudothermotoga lettingae]|uniref:YwsC n=1 Tax=Pseudothermotoga lettingae (strain ATCC BAA-301 / DSM 14385 / NBRC 107922 / TMO) TaxID=416591 RepID=A8F6E7_PSELT|nr:poly-gamma-glutamate synthase PgsB [Pseudothermotoga lettingae]ABV33731.1 YwsC [Pseudothermotoga lettingae TMO]GLI49350.1 PGA synthase CapB [Pseudothermotoga lettingae TMO]
MVIVLLCIAVLLTYLSFEAVLAGSRRNSVKLRIAVTGVRGKSSVTRLITGVFQQSGLKVIGKVTGSKPVLLYPDGKEEDIKRKKKPSVIEQVRVLLKKAIMLHVDGFVSETMSIKPEILRCEIQNILKPQFIAITRIEIDHTEDLGKTIQEIRQNIARACNPGATVVTMKENLDKSSVEILKRKGCNVIEIDSHKFLIKPDSYVEFDENLALAHKICEIVGIDESSIFNAFRNISGDIGVLRFWKLTNDVIVVNGFAANDPDSTIRVFNRAKEILNELGSFDQFVGILNLRADRVDRTVQWLNCLKEWFPFEKLYVVGSDSALFVKRLKNPKCVATTVEKLIDVVSRFDQRTVIFGFGNIAGAGMKLIEKWQENGLCLKLQP